MGFKGKNLMSEWDTEYWLTKLQLGEIEYSGYWNDEEREESKDWNIQNDNFFKMEVYLQKTGLLQDIIDCIECLNVNFKRKLKGIGIDLAAGNLWAATHLLSLGEIDKLYCLEYSKHRLLKIGPKVLEHYNVSEEKIVLVLGSFYNLHIKNNFLDFVFLSQAFHHADNPDKLLSEINRVLKQNGVAIIIGEHAINFRKAFLKTFIKHAFKFIASKLLPDNLQELIFKKKIRVDTLIPKTIDLFPPDPILGDHYYSDKEYFSLFSKYDFKVKQVKNRKSQFKSFLLIKRH